MKKRISLITLLRKLLVLTCLFIIFSARTCEEFWYDGTCIVNIGHPATGTIFNKNESITFSAYLYAASENVRERKRNNDIHGVKWTSSIDGIIATEYYSPSIYKANHSFSVNSLTAGIHTIKCYVLGSDGDQECFGQISISVTEASGNGNQNILEGIWNLFSIGDAPDDYTYSSLWEFSSDYTYHWVFWMKDELNIYLFDLDGTGTYNLLNDTLHVTGIVAETVIEGTPVNYMIIDYGQDNSTGTLFEYFSFPDDEGVEWLYTR